MHYRRIALLLLVTAVIGGAYWLWSSGEQAPAETIASARTTDSPIITEAHWPPAGQPTAPAPPPVPKDSPLLPTNQSQPAVTSMTDARERGDERAPPVQAVTDQREQATAWEMADPERYAAYEQRQQRRLYQAYVSAADQTLPKLAADLARAKSEGGIPPEEIAKVEEKQRRIAAVQAELRKKLASP